MAKSTRGGKYNTVNNNNQASLNRAPNTVDALAERYEGKPASDLQSEIGNIFRSMGSPMNGSPSRAEYERRISPYRQLINETINNGTGITTRDYETLLRTSIVRRRKGR